MAHFEGFSAEWPRAGLAGNKAAKISIVEKIG
jgi:hypothetical protein